jgi:hypothetical protein
MMGILEQFSLENPKQNCLCCFSKWSRPAICWAIQGGVAVGAVVDDKIYLEPVLYGLVYDFGGVLDHLRLQYTGHHFLNREGLGIGLLVAHLRGGAINRMTIIEEI